MVTAMAKNSPKRAHLKYSVQINCGTVTKSGIWMLVVQKPIKRQWWWKICFILDAGNWVEGGQIPVQRPILATEISGQQIL